MKTAGNAYLFVTVQLCIWMVVKSNKVLMISMDGFRWDYIKQVQTPNFDSFAAHGTYADYINNTFVTKTFPSHYSIATGLYEESHGIIANHMYDPVFNESFSMGTTDTKWWDGGEPLWVTTRKHGLKSAVYFWPGSEAKIRGLRPNIFYAYNESVAFKERVDTVVEWLSKASYNIDFAMLYFHEPDHTGHIYGPKSNEVKNKVKYMDGILGYIVKKFDENELWKSVNVLITSDHGMAEIDYSKRHIDISTYIDMDAIDRIPVDGPTANILPKAKKLDEIIQNLTGVDHLQVYKRKEIPEFWHYRNNRRILPILAVADEGWLIVKGPEEYNYTSKGTHGYDNSLLSMKPIFYARGPNIKVGYKSFPFNSVDIYPLVCELLGIKPSPNNGTLENTKSFIVYQTSGILKNEASSVYILLLYIILMFC